jgi:hypothetical protein
VLIHCDAWYFGRFKADVPTRVFDKHLDEAISLGFGIGSLVMKESTKGEDHYNPLNWYVIANINLNTPRWNAHQGQYEFFKLIKLGTSYSTPDQICYCQKELTLIHPYPSTKLIDFYSGKKEKSNGN